MAEQRGRPRRNAIDRVNISTDLTTNKKFLKLMAVANLTEAQAYLVCVRFWEFVGLNYALDGSIELDDDKNWINVVQPKIQPDDKYALKARCFYDGSPDDLIKQMINAGLLGSDLSVVEWFTHQPLAANLVLRRQAGSKGGRSTVDKHGDDRDNLGRINPSKTAENTDLLGLSAHENPSQERSAKSEVLKERDIQPGVVSVAPEARTREGTTPVRKALTGDEQDEFTANALDVVSRLKQTLRVKVTENDEAGIMFDIGKHGDPTKLEFLFELINQVRKDDRWHKIRSPVGWVREQIRNDARTRQEVAA